MTQMPLAKARRLARTTTHETSTVMTIPPLLWSPSDLPRLVPCAGRNAALRPLATSRSGSREGLAQRAVEVDLRAEPVETRPLSIYEEVAACSSTAC